METAQKSRNRGSFSSKIETAANVATLLTAVLLSVVLVKTYFLPTPSRSPLPVRAAESVTVGTSLKKQLSDIDFNKNGQTLILVLSSHCHFCTESAPFFRQLSEKSGKRFKIVAVLPQSVTEAQDYLKREGVHVDQLKQISLDTLGVAGTPTMLLLDKRGTVMESWVGMLNPEAQSQALKAIGATT
jgi:thioredoxin-related protein